MTKKQMAVHNRLSTKCQAYVKHNYPEIYDRLAAQVLHEYETGACRRVSLADLNRALKPRNLESEATLQIHATNSVELTPCVAEGAAIINNG